uniref:E3 ubiquitin-protein ligase hrd-1 n=1 Tax=Plectus sambesii TaxID=2011161 RepID=A0A914VU35_9BILA
MAIRLTASIFVLSSFALTALTISNAFMQKKQFYPSVVYISKSSPSMAVIYLQGMVLVGLVFQVAKFIFFGQLRAAETEHLTERGWYAITETCLAFTVFRDDFSPKFVMQFTLLLFLKCFHWLSEDRVDYMERSPIITVLFHARMMGLVAMLSAVDSYFVSHAYFTTLLRGATVQIVFGFEYAVLMTVVLHVAIKYILHMHDLRNVHPWEGKAVYLLYSELIVSLLRCILYTVFVAVMIRLHTFPLFSIRPFYLTIRAFKKALQDVVMSRRAIHAMNTLFPLATDEEIQQGDSTCIICREEMTAGGGAKKLPCNHIFHAACLRSWFQRQQTCPTCRTDILTPGRSQRAAAEAAAAAAQNGQPPQAAAQPAAQAQAPNPFLPFMPGIPPQFMQQQQPAAGAGGQQPSTSSAASPPPSAHFLPTTPPPFGFMPPPFMMMPPMPLPFPAPPAFTGLTDEEVRTMEGTERRAIEARVNCLRNIGVLLDAAAIQLQQYTSILATISATSQYPERSRAPTAADVDAQPSTASASNAGASAPSTESTTITSTATSTAASSANDSQQTDQLASASTSSDADGNSTLEEIRQRR